MQLLSESKNNLTSIHSYLENLSFVHIHLFLLVLMSVLAFVYLFKIVRSAYSYFEGVSPKISESLSPSFFFIIMLSFMASFNYSILLFLTIFKFEIFSNLNSQESVLFSYPFALGSILFVTLAVFIFINVEKLSKYEYVVLALLFNLIFYLSYYIITKYLFNRIIISILFVYFMLYLNLIFLLGAFIYHLIYILFLIFTKFKSENFKSTNIIRNFKKFLKLQGGKNEDLESLVYSITQLEQDIKDSKDSSKTQHDSKIYGYSFLEFLLKGYFLRRDFSNSIMDDCRKILASIQNVIHIFSYFFNNPDDGSILINNFIVSQIKALKERYNTLSGKGKLSKEEINFFSEIMSLLDQFKEESLIEKSYTGDYTTLDLDNALSGCFKKLIAYCMVISKIETVLYKIEKEPDFDISDFIAQAKAKKNEFESQFKYKNSKIFLLEKILEE